ncbi:MAG: hypothetical protein Q7W13_17695 [Bacteroidia bacterium]|nr:hypothetical protein [Bacteroidia bacterium]
MIIPISIKGIKKIGRPNRFNEIKRTDEAPIPIGKDKFRRKRKLISSFFLKMIVQDRSPSKKDNNIKKNSII